MLNEQIELLTDSDDEEHRPQQRRRVYKPRMEHPVAAVFRERFRMMPWQADLLLNQIGQRLESRSWIHTAMSAKHKLLAALRFYASNGFYYFAGDAQGYNKSTIFSAVRDVTAAICELIFPRIVQWPATEEENLQIEWDFYHLQGIGLARICGAIDGSLIRIKPPKEVERFYVDRHHKHSINLTAVADSKYFFRYVNASNPGSVSDARVLRKSALARKFDRGWRPFPGAVLLGDSIYATCDWLAPMRNHPPVEEMEFYNKHAKTRRVIECAFGILKNRFYCLSTQLRVKKPEFAARIINACCALHNFLLVHRDEGDQWLQEDKIEIMMIEIGE